MENTWRQTKAPCDLGQHRQHSTGDTDSVTNSAAEIRVCYCSVNILHILIVWGDSQVTEVICSLLLASHLFNALWLFTSHVIHWFLANKNWKPVFLWYISPYLTHWKFLFSQMHKLWNIDGIDIWWGIRGFFTSMLPTPLNISLSLVFITPTTNQLPEKWKN